MPIDCAVHFIRLKVAKKFAEDQVVCLIMNEHEKCSWSVIMFMNLDRIDVPADWER